MLDLPQQHTVVVHLRSELQAEGTAGAVALVLAAQGQVGLGTHAGDRDAGVVMTANEVAAEKKNGASPKSRLDSTRLNSHSSDRSCSAASAPGSCPALSPAPSAAAPGWPAARRCACADGSCPAGSRCTPAAGCRDCAGPWREVGDNKILMKCKLYTFLII